MRQRNVIIAAGLAGTVATLSVHAQEAARTVTTARISTELEFNDNYDLRDDSAGDSVLWNTTIGAGLRASTSVDQLAFDASGVLRVADLPGSGTDTSADNPIVSLAYDRAVDDSEIGFSVVGQRADLDFFDPLSDLDEDGNFDDTSGGGTRNSVRLRANIALNQDGPISLTGFGSLSDISYEDTSDPDLNDRRNANLGAEVGFRLSPILRLTTGASVGRDDIDDDTETERNRWRADVGMVGQINQRATLTARIGYSRVETDRTTRDETEEGIVGDVSVVFDERRGQTSLSFATTLDENGERYTLSYGKTVAWDNAEITASLGVSTNEDTDPRAVGSIDYQLTGRDTQLTLGLTQNAATDDDGRNVLNTNALARVERVLTRTSSIGLTVQGGLQRIDDDSDESTERLNVTAQFNHALTEDWNANFGYRYRYRSNEIDEESLSNSVFVGLERRFQASR
ncbi:hypothetical protein ACVDG3_12465 [Meridianimarinicoccus sp. RP-17]|uniref:hypothetical protein n=1 Tax=Meridianimarinicoccus zhengii TaxID=2056810 RepID=UPI0013A6D926|nr:hypothetical protein [Phycocomes zhengii]